MKKTYLKTLLVIGLMVCALFVMSAELVKVERHTLDVQVHQDFNQISVDFQSVDLTAFVRMPEVAPLNEAEVEISYGLITKTNRYFTLNTNSCWRELYVNRSTAFIDDKVKFMTQKQKCTRLDLKKSGTAVLYSLSSRELKNVVVIQINNNFKLLKEVRIRGRPTTNGNRM